MLQKRSLRMFLLLFVLFAAAASAFSYLATRLYQSGLFGEVVRACKDAASACYQAASPIGFYLSSPTKILVAIFFMVFCIAVLRFIVSSAYSWFIHADLKTHNYYKSKKISTILSKHKLGGVRVKVLKSHKPVAYTYGFLDPAIFISTKIINELSYEELESVVLHEAAHVKHRDNIWGSIVTLLKDITVFLPIGTVLYRLFWIEKEHEADDFAKKHTGNPIGLASAIIKISRMSINTYSPAGAAAFSRNKAIEGRVKRLLDKKYDIVNYKKRLAVSLVISIIFLFSIVAVSFALPVNEASSGQACNMKQGCSDMQDQACGQR